MLDKLFNYLAPIDNSDLVRSSLYNEATFYKAFISDLRRCKRELIIESPFSTNNRLYTLLPTLKWLKRRGVKIVVNTKDPEEQCNYMKNESLNSLAELQRLGIQVIYTNNHHRKLAILDRNILWEGSLNILSQNSSKEIMRRIQSPTHAWQMIRFIKLDKVLI